MSNITNHAHTTLASLPLRGGRALAGVLAVLGLAGLGACATEPDEQDPAELEVTEALVTSPAPASLALALPDEAGNLHAATIVTSPDLAPRAREILAGVRAIVRSGKATAALPATSYAQRQTAATTAVSRALAGGHSALLAIVFEDNAILGWTGPLGSPAMAAGPQDTQGGATYFGSLTTTTAAPITNSVSVYCTAGGGARGSLNGLSTSGTTVGLFFNAPAPLGSPSSASATLSFIGAAYNFAPTNYESWYYVRSAQTSSLPNRASAVSNALDCFWFGF